MPEASAASQAETLTLYAAVIGGALPCHAVILRRYAAQIADGLSADDAIADWPSTAPATPTASETTAAETANAETAVAEGALTEHASPDTPNEPQLPE